ncbi:hypothetical protein MMC18_007031 [Xylographa bjoerkii]|nr:hypothetical protein [Xylographa bjoerkii]
MIDRKLQISLVLPTGHQIDSPDTFFHNLYRVTLKNGEIWAVDTTGAQYGYTDPISPWRDFEQHRSGKIIREHEFGYIRHQAYPSHKRFPMRQMVVQKIEKQELAEALEVQIPALAREHGGKLNAILRGSDAAFKQAKDRFLDQLEAHIRRSMTKLYAPEQITRRNKEVERQLSQNMANPDRQKELDGFMRFMASTTGGDFSPESGVAQPSLKGQAKRLRLVLVTLGITPLTYAISEDAELDINQMLLEVGATTNAHSEYYQRTALDHAVLSSSLEVVALLLDHGADIEQLFFSYYGSNPTIQKTPLVTAISWGRYDITLLLLNRGADPNSITSHYTALQQAAVGADLETALLLLERGANPNLSPGNNSGALEIIFSFAGDGYGHLYHNYVLVIKELLQAGADPSAHASKKLSAYAFAKMLPKYAGMTSKQMVQKYSTYKASSGVASLSNNRKPGGYREKSLSSPQPRYAVRSKQLADSG